MLFSQCYFSPVVTIPLDKWFIEQRCKCICIHRKAMHQLLPILHTKYHCLFNWEGYHWDEITPGEVNTFTFIIHYPLNNLLIPCIFCNFLFVEALVKVLLGYSQWNPIIFLRLALVYDVIRILVFSDLQNSTGLRNATCAKKNMVAKKRCREGCVTCRRFTSSRWYKYEKIYHAFKMAKGVERKQICALCKLRMKPNEPTSVIRSSPGLACEREET